MAGCIRGGAAHRLNKAAGERVREGDWFAIELRLLRKIRDVQAFDIFHDPVRTKIAADLACLQVDDCAGMDPA